MGYKESLSDQLIKYPLQFCVPCFFSIRPSKLYCPLVKSGTISLIKFDQLKLGVTCYHVVQGFRELKGKFPDALFQIGNFAFDLLANLIDESKDLDIATINLSNTDLEEISIGRRIAYFEPSTWPPGVLKRGDFVTLGGFPRIWRKQINNLEVEFESFSLGATKVTDVSHKSIVCLLEREFWIHPAGHERALRLVSFGGLSGGPAFIFRSLVSEFVGIIYEYSENNEYFLLSRCSPIGKDGKIGSYGS